MGQILQLSYLRKRIKNFFKPKTQKTYPTLKLDNKTAKTELFAESLERHFGIECNNFNGTNLRKINQFVDSSPYIFTPLDSIDNGNHEKDDDHPLVANVDPQELISIVKFDLRKSKSPGHTRTT